MSPCDSRCDQRVVLALRPPHVAVVTTRAIVLPDNHLNVFVCCCFPKSNGRRIEIIIDHVTSIFPATLTHLVTPANDNLHLAIDRCAYCLSTSLFTLCSLFFVTWNCSPIWKASSRVGVSTSAYTPYGSIDSCARGA